MTATTDIMRAVPAFVPVRAAGRHRRGLRARDVLSTVAVLVIGLAWAVTLRPQSLGGPAGYVMVRGVSMNPTYHTGDLIVTHPRPAYSRADVGAYRGPKGPVGE